jgi:hypothetical protein
VGLAGGLGLSAKVGGGAGAREEAAENGLEEGLEDDLGTAVNWLVICIHLGPGSITYLVWGRAIQRIKTNLKI